MENLQRNGLPGGKGRHEGVGDAALSPKHRAEHHANAAQEQHRENRLDVGGETLAADDQSAQQDDGGVGKQDFPKPDVISREAVMEPELEHIAQEVSHDQRQRGGVRPKDRDIGKGGEPGGEKSVVIAEKVFRVGKGAARVRVFFHHRDIVPPDDEHDQGADEKPEDRAERPSDGQERRPRHDKSAPADGAAKGQRPDGDGGKIMGEPGLVRRARHFRLVRKIFHRWSLFSLGLAFPQVRVSVSIQYST